MTRFLTYTILAFLVIAFLALAGTEVFHFIASLPIDEGY